MSGHFNGLMRAFRKEPRLDNIRPVPGAKCLGIALKFFEHAGFFLGRSAPGVSLREHLRSHTRRDHEQLDKALASLDLSRQQDYARFLRFHAVARAGIEDWLSRHAPAEACPPQQLSLIEDDLAALGAIPPSSTPAFEAPAENWLGVSYVVAGSHLGNRMLLKQIDATSQPHAFLSGEAMQDYWKHLRPALEESVGGREANENAASARAAFTHFSRVAATTGAVLPA